MRIELRGLEVFGHHGVLPEEAERGQTFLFDIELDVLDPLSDEVEEAVDYREVVASVKEVSAAQRFQLIESLAAAVADALVDAFPAGRVCVTVRKRPPGIPGGHVSATVERP